MPRGGGTSSLPSFLPSLHYHLQQPEMMESTMTAHSDVVCSSSLSPPLTAMHSPVFPSPECFSGGVMIMGGERAGVQTVQSLSKEFFLLSIIHRASAPTPQSPQPESICVVVRSIICNVFAPSPPAWLWALAGCRANCKWVRCPVCVGPPSQLNRVVSFWATCSVKWLKILGTRAETASQARQFHSRQFPNE